MSGLRLLHQRRVPARGGVFGAVRPSDPGCWVYLQQYQLLPYERTSELLEGLFGGAPSEGTLNVAVERCAAGLAGTEKAIKEGLRAAHVAHFDETGFYVGGKRHWLHVAGTKSLTHYGWSPYFGYGCEHALCKAHHLRELTFVQEQDGQAWAGETKKLLLEIKARVEQERAAGGERLDQSTLRGFEERYQRMLAEGLAANPPPAEPAGPPGKRGRKKQSKAKNLLDRLSAHHPETLAFMYEIRVPFDNNLAERDIRMMKVQQKISGCFRSDDGATAFCRIRGYISTVRKQGGDVLPAIEHVFVNSPFLLSQAT